MLRWGSTLGVICYLVVFVAGLAVCAPKPKKQSTIAVPKFLNITKDASVEWLSSGFAETLSTKMAGVGGLQLIERSRLSEAIKELKLQSTALVNPSSAKKLGLFVGAEYVIVGSYQKVGDKVKADARKIEVETGKVVGAVDVTGSMESVLELQSDLAVKLINILGRSTSRTEIAMLEKHETDSVPAYEWNARGTQQNEMGNYDNAIISFTRALQLDGNYAAAFFNRGLAYYAKSDLENAIADYTNAVSIEPAYFVAYINRGVAYDDKGQSDKAIEDFNTALKIKSNYPEALNNRANAYKKKGDFANALQDYNAAIKLRPKDPLLYYNRGNLYMVMGKCDPAEDDYTSAIALNPTYEQAYNNRGSCMSRQGLCAKALADYKRAVGISPNYAIPYYNMGVELEGAGKKTAAIDSYKKFLKLVDQKDTNMIQKALNRIQRLSKGK